RADVSDDEAALGSGTHIRIGRDGGSGRRPHDLETRTAEGQPITDVKTQRTRKARLDDYAAWLNPAAAQLLRLIDGRDRRASAFDLSASARVAFAERRPGHGERPARGGHPRGALEGHECGSLGSPRQLGASLDSPPR